MRNPQDNFVRVMRHIVRHARTSRLFKAHRSRSMPASLLASSVTSSDETQFTGKQIPLSQIPVIDFGLFLHGDAAQRHEVAMQISAASRSVGFFYIKNHGIEPHVFQVVYAQGQKFFALPAAENRHNLSRRNAFRAASCASHFRSLHDLQLRNGARSARIAGCCRSGRRVDNCQHREIVRPNLASRLVC